MPILSVAARLANKFAFRFGMLANRFTIRHLRLPDVGRDAEFPNHAVHQDLEVEFTHPRKNGLSRIRIRVNPEGGIFADQLVQRNSQLFLVAFGFRLNRDGNHRRREFDRFQHDRILLFTDRIAGADDS